ncbi:polysaccharide deacetylase family protein [Dyadobacter sp. NIV53]|uniref:polysaccharide deacetylase family protein n=1 Tax=Dyadobacter sp. NIV53 TaxID=2861765 RepID=UPI001C84327A|nr:polysaccharide deacetylase family protein [Dyadobacter sp. NIV53]
MILSWLLLLSCNKTEYKNEKSGIAISFDDHFINEWYTLRPLLQKYNAKVTFFITCSDSLTLDEITKLKQLRKDGHEIGFHGTIHGKSTEMIDAFGPQKYAETELLPGLKYMSDAGFYPTSYAHPGGNHNDQVDSVLLANGFKILRDVAVSRQILFGIPLYTLAPRIMNRIYYDFNNEQKVDALLIDQDSGVTENEIQDAVVKAKNTNTALMIFGHKPLYTKPGNGEYGFNVSFLETILKEAKKQNLKFYTMTELTEH